MIAKARDYPLKELFQGFLSLKGFWKGFPPFVKGPLKGKYLGIPYVFPKYSPILTCEILGIPFEF